MITWASSLEQLQRQTRCSPVWHAHRVRILDGHGDGAELGAEREEHESIAAELDQPPPLEAVAEAAATAAPRRQRQKQPMVLMEEAAGR